MSTNNISNRPLNPDASIFVPQKMRNSFSTTSVKDQAYCSGASSHSSIDTSPGPNNNFPPEHIFPELGKHRSYWSNGSDLVPGGIHRVLITQPNNVGSSLTVFFSTNEPPTPVQYVSQPNLVHLLMNAMHEVSALAAELDHMQYCNHQLRNELAEIKTERDREASSKSQNQADPSTNTKASLKSSSTVSTQVSMTKLLTETQMLNSTKSDGIKLESGLGSLEKVETTSIETTPATQSTTTSVEKPPVHMMCSVTTTPITEDRPVSISEEPGATKLKAPKTNQKSKIRSSSKSSSRNKQRHRAFKIETNFERWTRGGSGTERKILMKESREPSKPIEDPSNESSSNKSFQIGRKKSTDGNSKLCKTSNSRKHVIPAEPITESSPKPSKNCTHWPKQDVSTPLPNHSAQHETMNDSTTELKAAEGTQLALENLSENHKIGVQESLGNSSTASSDSTSTPSICNEGSETQVSELSTEQDKTDNTLSCVEKKRDTADSDYSSSTSTSVPDNERTSSLADYGFNNDIEIVSDKALGQEANRQSSVTSNSETEDSQETELMQTRQFTIASVNNDNVSLSEDGANLKAHLSDFNKPLSKESSKNSNYCNVGNSKSETAAEKTFVPLPTDPLDNKTSASNNTRLFSYKKANKTAKKIKEKQMQGMLNRSKKENDEAINIALQENQAASAIHKLLVKYYTYIQKVRYTHFGFVKERPPQGIALQDDLIAFWEHNITSLMNIEQTARHCELTDVLNKRINKYIHSGDPEERKLGHMFLNVRKCLSESALRRVALQDMMFLLLTKHFDTNKQIADSDYFNMVRDFEAWKPTSFDATPVKRADIFYTMIDTKYVNHLVTFINVQARKRIVLGARLKVFAETECTDEKLREAYQYALGNYALWADVKCTNFMERRVEHWVNFPNKTVDHEMFIAFYDVLMGFRSEVINFDMYLLCHMFTILEEDEERSWTVEAIFLKSWFGYETERKLKYLKRSVEVNERLR